MPIKKIYFGTLLVTLFSLFYYIFPFWNNSIKPPNPILDSSLKNHSKESREEKKADKPDRFFNYFQFIKTGGIPANHYPKNYQWKAWKEAQYFAQNARLEDNDLVAIERGPSNIGGRTRTLIIDIEDSTNKIWFAGSIGGGVWKTEDAGKNWYNLTENLPNLAISSLVQSPSNPQVFYAGTGESFGNIGAITGSGIFKSENKGQNWQPLKKTLENDDFIYINKLAIHPKNQNILISVTSTGIFRTEDGGENWTKVYTARNSVEDLVFHADNFDILYASVNSEGILKSEDGGKSWQNPVLSLEKSLHFPTRISLAIAPQNPNKIFASTEISSSESGLFVSEDAGKNWTKVRLKNNYKNLLGELGWYANTISVSPYDENTIFVGGVNLFKINLKDNFYEDRVQLIAVQENNTTSFIDFVEVTGFDYWNKKLEINNLSLAVSVEIRFGKDKKQKAHRFTVPENRTSGVADSEYKFEDLVEVPFEVWDTDNNRQLAISFRDQGQDGVFNLIPRNTTSDIAIKQSREYFYIHNIDYQENINSSIAQNGGHKYQNIYFMWAILADNATWNPENLPEATLRIAYGKPVLQEASIGNMSDAYNEFSGKNRDLHPDHHQLILLPQPDSSLHIINTNDGGIALSEDGGNSFETRSVGYNTTQFYGIDKMPNNNRYIGGAQDNGTLQTSENTIFERVRGGDGFEAVWHATDANKLLATLYYNDIYRSTNGGQSWRSGNGGIRDKGEANSSGFMTRLGYSPKAPDLVFAVGRSGVWRSQNFGQSWRLTSISDNWAYQTFSASEGIVQTLIARVSDVNPNFVWAGAGMSDFTKLHISTDGGLNFRAVSNFSDFNAPLSGLVPHPTDSMSVLALFSVSGKSKILRSQDLGKTWQDLSRFESGKSTNGFPNVAVFSAFIFPKNPERIWAGTEIGVFESLDDGKSWHYLSNFLPATSIWDMKLRDNQIVIATHGRGIWTVDLPKNEQITSIENSSVSAEKLKIYPNPNSGKFRIKVPSVFQNQFAQIQILDTSGKLIFNKSQVVHSEIYLNLKSMISGAYTLQIIGKRQKTQTKLIIN